MAIVKGKWKFKDILGSSFSYQEVNFLSNQTRYRAIGCSDAVNAELTLTLNYEFEEPVELTEHDVYSFEDSEKGVEEGWNDDVYRTIDFGETEQEVSEEFYAWLVENAMYIENTKINITKSGITTLATAGMYCDRDIDVNVEVISATLDDKLIEKTITDLDMEYIVDADKLKTIVEEREKNECLRF